MQHKGVRPSRDCLADSQGAGEVAEQDRKGHAAMYGRLQQQFQDEGKVCLSLPAECGPLQVVQLQGRKLHGGQPGCSRLWAAALWCHMTHQLADMLHVQGAPQPVCPTEVAAVAFGPAWLCLASSLLSACHLLEQAAGPVIRRDSIAELVAAAAAVAAGTVVVTGPVGRQLWR